MKYEIVLSIGTKDKIACITKKKPCTILLSIHPDTKFEAILKKEKFLTLFQEYKENIPSEEAKSIAPIFEDFKKKDIYLDRISIFQKEKGTLKYLKQNPILKNYPLSLKDFSKLTLKECSFIETFFKDYQDVKLCIQGNHGEITTPEYKEIVYRIHEISSKIEDTLSPLEQTLYAYDIVREKIYKQEDSDYSSSRDLSKILKGNDIVCVGYVNLFGAILNHLGIENRVVELSSKKDKTIGHTRIVVYLKDDKYNLNGAFYFDPTFDSKKDENDTTYLTCYDYFCKSKMEMDYSNYFNELENDTFSNYDERFLFKIKQILEQEDITKVPKNMLTTMNELSTFIDHNILINPLYYNGEYKLDEEKIELLLYDLKRYYRIFFTQTLKSEDFLRALYEVRKLEHQKEPEKYPFTQDHLEKILKEKKPSKRLQEMMKEESELSNKIMECYAFRNQRTLSSYGFQETLFHYDLTFEKEKILERKS